MADQNLSGQEQEQIDPKDIKALSNALDDIIRKSPDLARFGKSMLYEEFAERFEKENKNQSALFDELFDAQTKIVSGVLDADSRTEAKHNTEIIKYFKKQIDEMSEMKEITVEESKFFNDMVSELERTNKQLLETDYSMEKVMKEKIKEKLPSITGLFGAIGLDNPAFMFLGSLIQDMVDVRKEKKQKKESLMSEAKEKQFEQMAKQRGILKTDEPNETEKAKKKAEKKKETKEDSWYEEKDIEISNSIIDLLTKGNVVLKEAIDVSNKKLEGIEDGVNILTKDSQGNRFAEIEKHHEDQIRHDETIDALKGLGGIYKESLISDKSTEKQGIFSKLLGIDFDSLMLMWLVFKERFVKFFKVLGKSSRLLGKLVGYPLLILESIWGAFKGWKNAAEKLNKSEEMVTITDRLSSAVGGMFGQLASIVDIITSFAGLDTHFGEWVDKKVTKIYLKFYETLNRIKDFFLNIFDIAFPEGFSLTNMIKAPFRLIRGWFEALFNIQLPDEDDLAFLFDKVKSFADELFDKIFDMVLNGLEKIPGVGKVVKQFRGSEPAGTAVQFIKDAPDNLAKNLGIAKEEAKLYYGESKRLLNIGKDKVTEKFMSAREKIKGFMPDEFVRKMIEEGDIQRNIIGYSEIRNWEKVKKANAEQIQDILDLNDWDKETTKNLRRILKDKEEFTVKSNDENQLKFVGINEEGDIKLSPIQPRINFQDSRTGSLYGNSINAAKTANAPKGGGGSAIVNAPKTTINNSTNKSSVHTNLSPRETDISIRSMSNSFGY